MLQGCSHGIFGAGFAPSLYSLDASERHASMLATTAACGAVLHVCRHCIIFAVGFAPSPCSLDAR